MPKGKIQREIESQKRYLIHLMRVKHRGKFYKIPKLTKRNVALNEAYINNDSDYIGEWSYKPGTDGYYFKKLNKIKKRR